MKKVSANTLKAWEEHFKDSTHFLHKIDLAKRAGRLSATKANNPSFGRVGSGDPLRDDELACLNEFRSEGLEVFGSEYEKRFGARHNSRPA